MRKAERQARFLRFVVDAALQSPEATLKEFDIAMAVHDRHADYDPRTDPIVRVEAARLRARLREYYEVTPPERVRIDIPKGQYVPQFIPVAAGPAPAVRDLSIMVAPFRSLSLDRGGQRTAGRRRYQTDPPSDGTDRQWIDAVFQHLSSHYKRRHFRHSGAVGRRNPRRSLRGAVGTADRGGLKRNTKVLAQYQGISGTLAYKTVVPGDRGSG